jgi:hypothetical protein
LLRGRDGLEFEPIDPLEGGLALGGDQKALVTLDCDRDARADFVIAQNSGVVALYRGQVAERPLCVRLRGKQGNPTGVGAVVTLRSADGVSQSRRITAGSGYLSQSAPCAFFASVSKGAMLRVQWPDGHVTERAIGENDRIVEVAR